MSNPLKRKREDLDDSDDEVPSFGRQILPVANLPGDFDGVPQDGMQYLFTVRRDAKLLPHVTRVPNPYEKPLPPPRNPAATPHPAIPSEEWCSIMDTRFKNLKQNLSQPTIHMKIPSNTNRKLMPDAQERALWWEFLSGKPESVWNPPKRLSKKKEKKLRGTRGSDNIVKAAEFEDHTTTIHPVENEAEVQLLSTSADDAITVNYRHVKPTPGLLKHIDERMALHLLMYFTHWINLHLSKSSDPPFPRLKQAHALWIFALLTRIEEHISADDMSLLRGLARACISLLETLIREKVSREISVSEELEEDPWINETSCWMITFVIVGFWGQRDLWMDAEDMLHKSSPSNVAISE
ncbi:hypothetical protein D9758_004770 [Tetrapyrgos nigripes]|uniref:Uncharacterized protein n=1 Tax=Tetrapyrgos nigripes TaxID=182062 RepID=A0A8H5LJ57_9AGAR|nr:hypothetical protein D9758_004770 [Tetrapyrgos nigripes]